MYRGIPGSALTLCCIGWSMSGLLLSIWLIWLHMAGIGDVRAGWKGICNFDVLRILARMIHGSMMFSIRTAQHMTQKNWRVCGGTPPEVPFVFSETGPKYWPRFVKALRKRNELAMATSQFRVASTALKSSTLVTVVSGLDNKSWVFFQWEFLGLRG